MKIGAKSDGRLGSDDPGVRDALRVHLDHGERAPGTTPLVGGHTHPTRVEGAVVVGACRASSPKGPSVGRWDAARGSRRHGSHEEVDWDVGGNGLLEGCHDRDLVGARDRATGTWIDH